MGPEIIEASGEQGEVFDLQMDTDRKWFESHGGVLYFRPQIQGEWNEQAVFGTHPPIIGPMAPDGRADFLIDQATWTAVVDVERFHRIAFERRAGGPGSGFRTRIAVYPMLNHSSKRETAIAVLNHVKWMFLSLRYKKNVQLASTVPRNSSPAGHSQRKPQGFHVDRK
jgi:hypothetical protein